MYWTDSYQKFPSTALSMLRNKISVGRLGFSGKHFGSTFSWFLIELAIGLGWDFWDYDHGD